jgi:signal recognition particle subunit SRP54
MTKKERENPAIINSGRKRRIAAGSGTRVQDVNALLRQFEQMKTCLNNSAVLIKKAAEGNLDFPSHK